MKTKRIGQQRVATIKISEEAGKCDYPRTYPTVSSDEWWNDSSNSSDSASRKSRTSRTSSLSVLRARTLSSNGKGFETVQGLGWVVTVLFLIGDLAGGGLIAMPSVLRNAGFYLGTGLIIAGGIVATVTGIQLGQNWLIMQQLWPEYRLHCRNPYAEMGLRACGPKFKNLVTIVLNITQFGTCVVFLLVGAKNVAAILRAFFHLHIHFCCVILLVAALLFPVLLLKSPKDFWIAVIMAMISTSIAVVLIIVGEIEDAQLCSERQYENSDMGKYPRLDISRAFLAFGTVIFTYGGHPVFPTVQIDMKKPWLWSRSVIAAYSVIGLLMYLPVSLIGYTVYGSALGDSIIPSIQTIWIQDSVNILITLHIILSLTILFNPLNQELEEICNVPQEFHWKRVVLRLATLLAVVLMAETMPNFGPLLDLLGATTSTLMSLVFPCLFNLYLTAIRQIAISKEKPLVDCSDIRPTMRQILSLTRKRNLFCAGIIMGLGLICGTTGTYGAVKSLITTDFSRPCYVLPFLALHENEQSPAGTSYCCGPHYNLTYLQNLLSDSGFCAIRALTY